MFYAREELCQQLYDLSGWGETLDAPVRDNLDWYGANKTYTCPKYPLGYLLRKLPRTSVTRADGRRSHVYYADSFELRHENSRTPQYFDADTPEDAAAKLAIELFKQGVLTKPEKDVSA